MSRSSLSSEMANKMAKADHETPNERSKKNLYQDLGKHIYGGGLSKHQNAINHGKRVWMTEHYISNTQTSMPNCLTIAKEISDCMNDEMSAYFWWWVYEPSSDNLVTSSGSIFKNGYTIGQFAKWIRPGSVRVGTTYTPNTNVYITAYKNSSGGVVIVAVNAGTTGVTQEFIIQGGDAGKGFGVHRTSGTESMVSVGDVSVVNNGFTYLLHAQSVTTFHP